MENNGIWIRIEFNTNNQYEGTDELLKELRGICPVQASTKWYPAACTGLEFDLALNFNLTLSAFLNNVVIPGLEFAAVCKAAVAVWKCFEKFYKKNEAIEIKELELTFDDVILLFNDVMSYGALLKFYNELPDHLHYLKSKGVENIRKIKLPYIKYTDEDSGKETYREWSLEDGNEEELFWKISYERGLNSCLYNPKKKEVMV